MLVLTGPPGSGKTHRILESIRVALRRGASEVRLVVPTATMAEHVRHRLVREGLLLRPAAIVTLSRFIAPWVSEYPEVSPAMLELLVERVLADEPPREFERVAKLPGFRAALCRVIDEFSSAGCDPHRLGAALAGGDIQAPLAAAFQSVYHRVERELLQRGWAARSGRLRAAAEEIRARGVGRIRQVFFDGFFTLSPPELRLIDALRLHTDVTVALPEWQGSEPARAALAAFGFRERRLLAMNWRAPSVTLFTAPALDQEVEEIARRVLEQVAAGRCFRDIGVVLRSRDPYVPALRAAFERFGIPARFYLSEPLEEHAVVRYLAGAVDAMRGGWDHAATLEVLKMAPSGFGLTNAGHRFDFAVREQLPGRGLDTLRELSDDARLAALLDRLARLECWAASRELPAQWAVRARSLRCLVQTPVIRDQVTHDQAALWRAQAVALDAFDAAMDEAAGALPPDEPLPFSAFWPAARLVLHRTPLRVSDRRRDVVAVIDAEEVRQWELPVVFVCGLLEKQFPQYHSAEPLFPDPARLQLQRAGIDLETSEQRQRKEEFLFEIAISRATRDLVLSYPECNAKGEPNLPSFFLDRFSLEPLKAPALAPPPAPEPPPARPPVLQDPALLALVRSQHAVLRPTAVEMFLQCPFQFFILHTLRLQDPPARPADRLGPMVLGQIMHQALADFERTHDSLDAVFERTFEQICDRERVPRGCRAELARVNLLKDLRRWLRELRRLEGWKISSEESIRFPLTEGLEVSGRIDRFDVDAEGRVVVFDFKYSNAGGIRRRLRGYEQGRNVQGALYLLGLKHRYGYTPAGFFYWGLRDEITLAGWHTGLPGFERTGTVATPQAFREQLETARATTLRVAAAIHEGRVEPWPNERSQCDFCNYGDLCRLAPDAVEEVEAAAE